MGTNLNIPKSPPDDGTESEESEDEPQCEGDECELYEEEVIGYNRGFIFR